MHVKSLKIFCDVVGRRSFSRAADENGISQSAASQVVLQLEERLGVKLIDRSKRPFVLTAEGEVYYQGCRKLVHRYGTLEEEVRSLHADVAGRVRVASIYSVGLSHMSQFVGEFLRRHPKANVRLEYQHPQRVYELVDDNQADLGLVSYPRSTRTIVATPWREEPMVAVCSPAHEWAARESVRLVEFAGQDMIGFDDHLTIRSELNRALAAAGVEPSVVMAFDNIETLKRAVEINAGVSLLPEPTIRRELQLGLLAAARIEGETLKRPLGVIRRRGAEVGKTARRFMRLLLEDVEPSCRDGRSGDGAGARAENSRSSRPARARSEARRRRA